MGDPDLYRLVFETAGDAILLIRDDRIVDCNQSALALFGCTSEELLGQALADLSSPTQPDGRASAPILREKVAAALSGEPQTFGWLSQRPDGATFRTGVTLQRLQRREGSPIAAWIQDLGEHTQAEAALEESEARYRAILESLEDGYYEVDLAGHLTFFNEALCRILGYPAHELHGMNYREYTGLETARNLFQAFNSVFTTGEPVKGFTWQHYRKDGTTAYVETSISLIRDATGEPVGFRGIARDVTERRQVEEALRASEERHRVLLEASPDPIAMYDEVGRATYVNPKFEQVFGWSADELLGKRIDFVPEENQAETQAAVERVFKEGSTAFETRRFTKAGEVLNVLVSASIYRDGEDNPAGIVVILRDISARKRGELERERLLAEAERRARHEQAIRDITDKLGAAPNLQALLETAARELGQRLEVPHTVLEVGIDPNNGGQDVRRPDATGGVDDADKE